LYRTASPEPHLRLAIILQFQPVLSPHQLVRVFFFLLKGSKSFNSLPGGSITLNSTDPFDPPVINPNLLGSELDLLIMREAVRSAQRFVAAPTLADYILSPFSLNDTASDTEVDTYIHDHATTLDHPVGTAAMSASDVDYGVVDPDLTVKGVGGLRIVDASVLVCDCAFSLLCTTDAGDVAVCSRGAHAGFGVYICREGSGFNQSGLQVM
jgi:hypothetical protein